MSTEARASKLYKSLNCRFLMMTDLAQKDIAILDAALRDERRIAWDEAAKIAEEFGVHPALNVANGGPEWYRHGKDIATMFRAKAAKETV